MGRRMIAKAEIMLETASTSSTRALVKEETEGKPASMDREISFGSLQSFKKPT